MEQEGFDEAGIIVRAQGGDKEAFGLLFDRYFDDVFSYLSAQLPRREDAEDLTLEIFQRTWEYLPRYKDKGHSLSAFLFSAARNALVDHFRRNKYRTALESEADDSLVDEGDLPEEILLLNRERARLVSALQNIPADYRQVLVLRFINEVSLAEIAVIMRRSPGAVRVLQHRALKALKKVLEAQEATGE